MDLAISIGFVLLLSRLFISSKCNTALWIQKQFYACKNVKWYLFTNVSPELFCPQITNDLRSAKTIKRKDIEEAKEGINLNINGTKWPEKWTSRAIKMCYFLQYLIKIITWNPCSIEVIGFECIRCQVVDWHSDVRPWNSYFNSYSKTIANPFSRKYIFQRWEKIT